MTDNEIIKALEEHLQKCQNIKYGSRQKILVDSDFLKDVLDLINRQKAEIETLREIVYTDRTEAIKKIKSEAIKEYVKEVIHNILPKYLYGHEETALRIGFALSEKAIEMTEKDDD